MSEWYRKAGTASRAGFDVAIGPREAGWEHTGLYVVTLAAGESRSGSSAASMSGWSFR